MSKDVFLYPLPVVVATGEFQSGKTLLILTTGYPLERVLLYDNEESATLYAGNGGFTRVDIIGELSREKPGGWTNFDFYVEWRDHMRAIEPGQYDVIGVDPIERVEAGIADWVRQNAGHFGHTPGQYKNMSGMYWGDVKNLWGQHILEMKSKAKMVILTAHMRQVYENGRPVKGQRQRKGKDTLSELATLELELVRKDGMVRPGAKILKSRLVYGDIRNPASLKPMFDSWIPEFTWDKVREFMKTGASDNPEPAPGPTEEEQEEMRRLELEAEIARAKLMEAEAIEATDDPELAAALKKIKNGKALEKWIKELGMDKIAVYAILKNKYGSWDNEKLPDYIRETWSIHKGGQTEGEEEES